MGSNDEHLGRFRKELRAVRVDGRVRRRDGTWKEVDSDRLVEVEADDRGDEASIEPKALLDAARHREASEYSGGSHWAGIGGRFGGMMSRAAHEPAKLGR